VGSIIALTSFRLFNFFYRFDFFYFYILLFSCPNPKSSRRSRQEVHAEYGTCLPDREKCLYNGIEGRARLDTLRTVINEMCN
jgi:hypothetical protein